MEKKITREYLYQLPQEYSMFILQQTRLDLLNIEYEKAVTETKGKITVKKEWSK